MISRTWMSAIDPKYPPENYSWLKQAPSELSLLLLAPLTPSPPPTPFTAIITAPQLPSTSPTLPFVLLTPRQYTGDLWIFTPVEYVYYWQCIIFARREINILLHDTHTHAHTHTHTRTHARTHTHTHTDTHTHTHTHTRTHVRAEVYNGSACVHKMFEFYRTNCY